MEKRNTPPEFIIPQSITLWIEHTIRRPIAGFEQKKRATGKEYTREEQLRATKYQLQLIAYSYLQRGRSTQEVIAKLYWFVN